MSLTDPIADMIARIKNGLMRSHKKIEMPASIFKTRIKNRCEITGRAHGVYRKLKVSRIALRELTLSGKIPGMVKSSW